MKCHDCRNEIENCTCFEASRQSILASAPALPDWHRISIRHDGVDIIELTVTCKRPENHEQMTELVRELLKVLHKLDK